MNRIELTDIVTAGWETFAPRWNAGVIDKIVDNADNDELSERDKRIGQVVRYVVSHGIFVAESGIELSEGDLVDFREPYRRRLLEWIYEYSRHWKNQVSQVNRQRLSYGYGPLVEDPHRYPTGEALIFPVSNVIKVYILGTASQPERKRLTRKLPSHWLRRSWGSVAEPLPYGMNWRWGYQWQYERFPDIERKLRRLSRRQEASLSMLSVEE
jgi:hypothetical protein